jgi:uncharacterized membrane protein SpoIIM required for sporulation
MTERRFVEARTTRWAELRALVDRAQMRGLSSLSGAEIRRLGALYRLATTDLALARSLRYAEPTVQHVNRLTVAAHDLVYAGHRAGGGVATAARFLVADFPALVRRTWRYHAFAAATTVAAGIAAYFVFRGNPDLVERTFGATFAERAERAASEPEGARRYMQISNPWMPVMSWGIMANNIRVAMVTFSLAALLCVGGVLMLAVTGVMVGAGLATFHDAGVGEVMWTFMSAHGPMELTAIFVATGAGLRLGMALLAPGRRTRAAAFQEKGLEAVKMLLGVMVLLVLAGLLEGFLSPSEAPAPVKWAAGGTTALFMAWYFTRAGRDDGRDVAAHPA